MDDAFKRLTFIQQDNINKETFAIAYECVVNAGDDNNKLFYIVQQKVKRNPSLITDLLRYCKLVKTVM